MLAMAVGTPQCRGMKLYQVVAQELEGMIRGRTLNSGDQLRSVRAFCQARKK